MIISFYDKAFKGLQNNASLVVDKRAYSLIKRPVKANAFSCSCEPYTQDIQPTFLIVKDDIGNYIYGCLAGIPLLNSKNQTEITGTDLKMLLSSDIIIQPTTYSNVSGYLTYIFNMWNTQVNQNSFTVELQYIDNSNNVAISNLLPSTEKRIVNAYEEMTSYLNVYNLYIDSKIDLINKKVIFTIGKAMQEIRNIKLWEMGIVNYSKWIASVNETQGYYNWTAGTRFILLADNSITSDTTKRNIYPIKRRVFNNTESLQKADEEALTNLIDSLYNESIEFSTNDISYSFKTKFAIYISKGKSLYKYLPCGELQYDYSGLKKVKIGYRYDDISFI